MKNLRQSFANFKGTLAAGVIENLTKYYEMATFGCTIAVKKNLSLIFKTMQELATNARESQVVFFLCVVSALQIRSQHQQPKCNVASFYLVRTVLTTSRIA